MIMINKYLQLISLWLSQYHGKPQLVYAISGVIAGLAGVTPASGFISGVSALVLGLILGIATVSTVGLIKHHWHIDDALNVSCAHGLSGLIGSIYM
jgi:Amt family ammonium transporter